MKTIQLSHGGGGEEMGDLIKDLFFKHFANEVLLLEEDAAVLEVEGKIAFTTDSFVVSPIIFNGGDIGKIAVAGTVNDLAMMGAKPKYLTCGFILEEGLEFETLETIVKSMAKELKKSGAKIVAGDTKVVPRGACDRIFINTSGVGEIVQEGISINNIREGDAILVSRDIGAHGACILQSREGIDISSDLKSDCNTLWEAVEKLISARVKIKAMRDATRGGLSAVLNEWSKKCSVAIEIEEEKVPIQDEVRGICEIFGFEPFDFANEGTFVLAVKSEDAQRAKEILRDIKICDNSEIIGVVKKGDKVTLKNPWGSSRFLDLPKGELLPRIC